METVSPLEVIWTTLAAVESMGALVMFYLAAHDYRVAKANFVAGGSAIVITRRDMRIAKFCFVLLFIFSVIGVVAMLLPNSPGQFTVPRLVIFFGFYGIEVYVGYIVWADWRDRKKLLGPIGGRRIEDKPAWRKDDDARR